MRERLIELLRNCCNDPILMYYDLTNITDSLSGAGYLADYLIANGVVVLPYQAGDTIYVVSSYYAGAPFIYECKLTSVTFYKCNTFIQTEIKGHSSITFGLNIDQLNKDFFLTRQEAEAALERRSE